MGRPRFFFTGPARLIGDPRPTALDLRCLACIAFHDGMSKVSGKGGGCYAKHSTLAKLCNTDVSNFSKSLSRLIGWGYVAREPQLMDKRRFTLRVVYGEDDGWRTDQQSGSEIVGEPTNSDPEIVGEADSKNGGISRETDGHYISLNEEINSDESEKLNSSKRRDFGNSRISPEPELQKGNTNGDEIDYAEAGLGREAKSLWPHLPEAFHDLDSGAQVSRLERAFKAIGSDPQVIPDDERSHFYQQLEAIADAYAGEAIGSHALRLQEEMMAW